MYNNYVNIEEFKGKIFTSITGASNGSDKITFTSLLGEKYVMFHDQDCCEYVIIDDIDGDIYDLLDSPILQAEEVTNSKDKFGKEDLDSFTWTFYKLATIKGYVTIKWLGESNGYYSESVSIEKIMSE